MLDLVSVASQLRDMRAGMASLADAAAPRLAQALRGWEEAAGLGPGLLERLRAAKTSWLVPTPLEPLAAYPVAGVAGGRVVAADGSQIFPDRHELGAAFLVNVGTADIDYGTGSARLSSAPEVCWAPEDVYPLFGGERQEADGRIVGARRFGAECEALTGSLCHAGSEPALLLVDGTLLLWWLEPDPERLLALAPEDLKTRTLEALRRLLSAAREKRAQVAGYLSGPRATDVVSMLKVILCTEDPVDCDRCPYESGAKVWEPLGPASAHTLLPAATKPCEEAHPLSDAAVFSSLLAPGERSARFRSAAQVTAAYDVPIDFVYMNVGAEVARVEFPAWTTPAELDTLLGLVADQCRKGFGYPVALAEAHEQAVVRAADRRTFGELLRRQDVSRPTAKLLRKRTSVL